MSRTKYKRRSNRSAKILASIFSIMIVSSLILSMVGSFFTSNSSQPAPTATFAWPTLTPTPLPGAEEVPTLAATPDSSP